MQRDTVAGTFIVAFVLCVVCSIFVSVTAVGLGDIQAANKALDKKKNILVAAGLYEEGKPVDELFKQVQTSVVNLDTGETIEGPKIEGKLETATYDQRKAASKPEWSVTIPPAKDLGGIKRRERYSNVYTVKKDGKLDQIIVPINGKGLWSTLYGFLAIDKDLATVRGITFYEHKETPGLGGEVDNPKWKALWPGKKLYAKDGDLAIEVIKGTVDASTPGAQFKVDGLAGATITARGVGNLVRYWLGEHAFGPYLERVRQGQPGQARAGQPRKENG